MEVSRSGKQYFALLPSEWAALTAIVKLETLKFATRKLVLNRTDEVKRDVVSTLCNDRAKIARLKPWLSDLSSTRKRMTPDSLFELLVNNILLNRSSSSTSVDLTGGRVQI